MSRLLAWGNSASRVLYLANVATRQHHRLDTSDNWRQFQRVLTVDDYAMWNWLTDLRSHAPNVPTHVSNLRMLDVLLWMTVDQKR
jgi:hypothetical protein